MRDKSASAYGFSLFPEAINIGYWAQLIAESQGVYSWMNLSTLETTEDIILLHQMLQVRLWLVLVDLSVHLPSDERPNQRHQEPKQPINQRRVKRTRATHIVKQQASLEVRCEVSLPLFEPSQYARSSRFSRHATFILQCSFNLFAQAWPHVLLLVKTLGVNGAGEGAMHLDVRSCMIHEHFLTKTVSEASEGCLGRRVCSIAWHVDQCRSRGSEDQMARYERLGRIRSRLRDPSLQYACAINAEVR